MFHGTLKIRTPEGIVFSLPLAGPVARFLALAIDLACIAAASAIAGKSLTLLAWVSPDLAQAIGIALYFVISIGYGIALEWHWRGQTIGKRLMRIRVMDREAMHLTAGQIVLRNLIRAVDMLPAFYLVGGAAFFFTRYSQRLGDLAANTIVIRSRHSELPDVSQLRTGKYNSLRGYPHLAARLRRNVPPEALAIAADAVLRRDELDPGARLELFRELADTFRAMVVFPAEAVEDIADEQYVRNVLEIMVAEKRG